MSDTTEKKAEVWLRGPVEGVPALLQPLAHAILQANEEVHALLSDLPPALIWKKPAGVASVAFHLQHISGVLDRLFTYANGGSLSSEQLKYLSEEGMEKESLSLSHLLSLLDKQVSASIQRLKQFDERELTLARAVGRKKLPSTVLGLLFHAAEHTMRHTGQLLVTAKILTSSPDAI